MPFKKGHKKFGGRQKGNKLFREIIEDGLNKPIPERVIELIHAHPERELEILLALLPYCYCKLAPVLMPPPPNAEELALQERRMAFLDQAASNDPDPPREN